MPSKTALLCKLEISIVYIDALITYKNHSRKTPVSIAQ